VIAFVIEEIKQSCQNIRIVIDGQDCRVVMLTFHVIHASIARYS